MIAMTLCGKGKTFRGGILSYMMFYLSRRLVTVTTMRSGEQSIVYEHNLLYAKIMTWSLS